VQRSFCFATDHGQVRFWPIADICFALPNLRQFDYARRVGPPGPPLCRPFPGDHLLCSSRKIQCNFHVTIEPCHHVFLIPKCNFDVTYAPVPVSALNVANGRKRTSFAVEGRVDATPFCLCLDLFTRFAREAPSFVSAIRQPPAPFVYEREKISQFFSAKLLAAATDKPIEIIEAEKQKEAVPVGGRDTKAK
jgi:hypothetical protein